MGEVLAQDAMGPATAAASSSWQRAQTGPQRQRDFGRLCVQGAGRNACTRMCAPRSWSHDAAAAACASSYDRTMSTLAGVAACRERFSAPPPVDGPQPIGMGQPRHQRPPPASVVVIRPRHPRPSMRILRAQSHGAAARAASRSPFPHLRALVRALPHEPKPASAGSTWR